MNDWDCVVIAGGVFAALTGSGTPPNVSRWRSVEIAGDKITIDRMDGERFEIRVARVDVRAGGGS